jgi:hypothetical protein
VATPITAAPAARRIAGTRDIYRHVNTGVASGIRESLRLCGAFSLAVNRGRIPGSGKALRFMGL